MKTEHSVRYPNLIGTGTEQEISEAQPMPKMEKDNVRSFDPNQSHTPKAPQKVGKKTPCKNLEQQKIEIYEDKLLLILMRNQPTADRWKSPLSVLGILLPLLLALVTSTFHEFADLNKDFWKAFFNICTFVVWEVLVYFLCVAKSEEIYFAGGISSPNRESPTGGQGD